MRVSTILGGLETDRLALLGEHSTPTGCIGPFLLTDMDTHLDTGLEPDRYALEKRRVSERNIPSKFVSFNL